MSVERSELNVERSAPRGAVFLSYAREDAVAAKRIAEALRAFGVEVWFDQNELRGGDQWDVNIRGQIKSCSLFVPIISERTEERDTASSAGDTFAQKVGTRTPRPENALSIRSD